MILLFVWRRGVQIDLLMMMCLIWSSRFLEFLLRFQYGLYVNNFYYIIIVLRDSFYKEVVSFSLQHHRLRDLTQLARMHRGCETHSPLQRHLHSSEVPRHCRGLHVFSYSVVLHLYSLSSTQTLSLRLHACTSYLHQYPR